MLAETYAYLSTVFGKALLLALFLNGLLGLATRMSRPIEVPRKIVVWLSIPLLFVAGFQAWRDERAQRGHDTSASTGPAPARHLTVEQRRVLSNTRFVGQTPGCELALTFTHTFETELFAREIGNALQQAGWPLLYSRRDTGKASCRFELQVDDVGTDAHTLGPERARQARPHFHLATRHL